MQTLKYKVPDMHCPACTLVLEGLEDELPGVNAVVASYHKQELIVEFDEALVSAAQIQAAAEKKGYPLILLKM